MELLTQDLPSGYHYPFTSITIMPMTFAQILEYLENVPDAKKAPIEKYYFDYCLLRGNDDKGDGNPMVDDLLLIDMEYALYMKKALTVAENLQFNSEVTCPRCGARIPYHVSLAGIKWEHMDPEALEGIQINFGGEMQPVKMPTVRNFLNIFKKYRMYKKVTDMRIIRLIALFEQSQMYLQKVENQVINATYKDVSSLFMLEQIYYTFVTPQKLFCADCAKMYRPTQLEIHEKKLQYNIDEEDDLPNDLLEEIQSQHGGLEIGMENIVSNFFRDVCENNRLTPEEVLPGKVR